MDKGMAGGCCPHPDAQKPGGTGLETGGSEEPDIETIAAAPVGLDQLAPFRLCLEQVRQTRAGRAGFGQHCLAMLPGEPAHGRLMQDAHDARLDLAEHEGSLPENDLAEIVPLLEDDSGCSLRAAQTMPGFGAVALFAADDQLVLADHDPVLGSQHDAVPIPWRIESIDAQRALVKQPVGVMGAQVLEPVKGSLAVGD